MNFISKSKRIFFVGISGIGMSSIAIIMKKQGYEVCGSCNELSYNVNLLKSNDITVYIGHAASNVLEADLVVVSTAIKEDNVELIYCKNNNIPILHRSEMISILSKQYQHTIAVSGCHGKTTSSSLMTFILNDIIGINAIIGGVVPQIGWNGCFSETSSNLVIEADESDGTLVNLSSDIAVVLNIDLDHTEFFKSNEELLEVYIKFATNKIVKTLIVGNSMGILEQKFISQVLQINPNINIITFGFDENVDYQICNAIDNGDYIRFQIYHVPRNVNQRFRKNLDNENPDNIDILLNHDNDDDSFDSITQTYRHQDEQVITLESSLHGLHNTLNATASFIVAKLLGIEEDKIVSSIKNFKGVERRFTIIHDSNHLIAIDDYAHHHLEIEATVMSAKKFAIAKQMNRIVCVIQPHRFTRVKSFFKEIADVIARLSMEGIVFFILNIYSAGEKAIDGIDSNLIAKEVLAMGGKCTVVNDTLQTLFTKEYNPYDIWLFMGAGDISKKAKELDFTNLDRAKSE